MGVIRGSARGEGEAEFVPRWGKEGHPMGGVVPVLRGGEDVEVRLANLESDPVEEGASHLERAQVNAAHVTAGMRFRVNEGENVLGHRVYPFAGCEKNGLARVISGGTERPYITHERKKNDKYREFSINNPPTTHEGRRRPQWVTSLVPR